MDSESEIKGADSDVYASEILSYLETLDDHVGCSEVIEKSSEKKTQACDSPTLISPATEKICLSPLLVPVDHKTPHSHTKHRPVSRRSKRHVEAATPPKTRETPLPLLHWADSSDIWQNMVYKEEVALVYRNSRLFEDTDSFLPRVRAILLNWIMEVCEAYRLRRVTYYLTVDYIDRYLTVRPDLPKNQLQLVGVSCLFIASKMEEVYPPKLSEFSYVCDGACTDDEILHCELIILTNLSWDINPLTPSGWLNLYMQIHYDAESVVRQRLHDGVSRNFFFPQYSGFQFVRASQIIDLFSLDPGFLQFSYSVIAAGAVYFVLGKQAALRVSGFSWDQLKYCVEYMAVFNKVIRDSVDPRLMTMPVTESESQSRGPSNGALRASIPDLTPNENHSMQTHCVDLDYFERAVLLRLEQMGLRVQKTVYKKTRQEKNDDDEKENHENESSPTKTKTDDDEVVAVMYEIEKINMEKSIGTTDGVINTSCKEEADIISPAGPDVNIFSVERMTRFTFDHILHDINDEFTRKLVPASDSEDESL